MLNIILATAFVLFSLAVLLATIVACEYFGARYNVGNFTTVKESTIKAIHANGKLIGFIPNVRGHFYNDKTRKIEIAKNGEDKISHFTETTGLYHTSWIWPIRKVLTFDILKVRLAKNSGSIKEIENKIEVDANVTTVDHLLWKIDRPFYMDNVDLKDGSKIKILAKGIFTTWDPELMLFGLAGHFFDNLDTVVKGYLINKYEKLTYDEFLAQKNTIDLTELKYAYMDDKRIDEFDLSRLVGLIAESIIIEESLSADDEDIQKAKKGIEVAKHNKEEQAIRTETEEKRLEGIGRGTAKAIELAKVAEVAGYKVKIDTMTKIGMNPETMGKVLEAGELKELKGTLVQAGAGVNTTIMASHASTEKSAVATAEPGAKEAGKTAVAVAETTSLLPTAPVMPQRPTTIKKKRRK